MNWIFIALIAPFVWAFVNHLDKFLLTKYGEAERGISTLMLFSTLFSVFVVPILFFIDRDVVSTDLFSLSIFTLGSLLYALFTFLYLHALIRDEATIIMPIFQTIPVFGFVFSFFLLSETLTSIQTFGSLIIILFSILLMTDGYKAGSIKIKWAGLFFAFGASAVYALSETLFKFAAVETTFLQGLFWTHVGLLLFGLLLLLPKKNRDEFKLLIRESAVPVLSLNVTGETLTMIGDMVTKYALLLAPVTLVFVVSGAQPAFVFIIGTILTILYPAIFKEDISKSRLLYKLLCILFITIGSTLIVIS